jgi:FAD/FMN-containing dehydrogenase
LCDHATITTTPPMNTRTASSTPSSANAVPFARLREQLAGALVLPDSTDYDQTRRIWNGMIDRRPAAIARCANANDVAHAVGFAREHRLLLAVKGGGHNVAGNAVCDGGLTIDLGLMRTVSVDAPQRIARVGAGCLLSDFDREAQQHGLATPGGVVSTTGIAGLTLGGGFGWISRKYGLTIDRLLAADVVLADGRRVVASETENGDLFWGLRGGGGNFGIVTEFTFRLHPVGPNVYSGLIIQPFANADKYLRFHRDFVRSAPDELTVWAIIRHAPPLPFLPADVHGQLVVAVAFVYLGDATTGEKLIAPLRRFGRAHGEAIGMNPFAGWQTGFDALNAAGAGNYWKSHYLRELSDGVIDIFVQYAQRLPTPQSEIFVPHLDGAISRVPAPATAFQHRAAPFLMNLHARWENPADQTRSIAWARELFEAARPHSTGGVYVNFLSEEGDARVRDAYGDAAWSRLVALKDKYDSENIFRLNQNIRPSRAGGGGAAAVTMRGASG